VKAVIQKIKELSEDSLQGASSEQLQQLRVLLEQKLAALSKMLDA
jgi:ParB family transcriptional regulator, chromosome partitioning protein